MVILKNGMLVGQEGTRCADIRIEGEIIAEIAPRIEAAIGDEVIDAEGCLVFPGFIDVHTHFDMDNGVTVTADDFDSGTAAALMGGTTTIVDFATQERGGTLAEGLAAWHAKADGKAHCDYGFHMAITDWNAASRAEIKNMVNEGVTSFKAYMAYDALRVDDAQMLDLLGAVKEVGGILGVHCENGTLVNALIAKLREQGDLSPTAHPRSRPAETEAEAISRLLYISKLADYPVKVVHLSSAAGLAEVRKARADGQKVLVETCPQYLLLQDDKLEGNAADPFSGAKFVCSPPLRKPADSKALLEALRGGEIGTVATDHCSFNYKGQKELGRGDFAKIPNGMPGVESRAAVMYSAFVASDLLLPEQLCALLSTTPAKEYGMYPRKGTLAVGSDADIVVWRKEGIGKISAAHQRQNVDYTPFEGFVTTGGVQAVLLRGRVAVQGGELIQPRRGRFVHRGKAQF